MPKTKVVVSMPRACLKPCKFGGCPNLTDRRDNLCADHAKSVMANYNKFERDPDYKNRYGYAWRKIRERYLNAHPICEMCEAEGRLTAATLVHHRKKLGTEGGTNDTENLQALCNPCHEQHHRQEGDRWGGKSKMYEY